MSIESIASQLAVAALVPVLVSVSFADMPALDEIVVTARRVEERLQDVPVSVQVVSGEYLDEADLSHLFSLQYSVPGLVVNNLGGYGAGFSLRGVADQGGSSLSVASYANGVYLGSADLAIARLFDLDRIEVLKGPQGTLYGRNSTGGSINFISRAPGDSFSSELEAAYGSFNTLRVQGFVNLPSEKADLRLAFIASEGDGFIRNTFDNRRFAEQDFYGLRASLRVKLNDRFSLDLVAQHITEDGASGELWLPNPLFLPDPDDLQLTTVTLADPFLKTDNDIVSIDAAYDFDFATLRSISGYAESKVDDKDDCAGLPDLIGCVRKIGPDTHTQWSQEFQLTAPTDAAIDWIAGAYYFKSDVSAYFYLLPSVASPMPQNDRSSTADNTAIAVYGQATLPLSNRWSMTAGLRYSDENSRLSDIGAGIRDNKALTVADYDGDHVSWRLDAAYAATEDLLVYASIATGFKSGGVTTDRLPNGSFDGYKPEELLAYESGIKSQWLERRLTLNASAFFYDFRNLQVNTVILEVGNIHAEVDNAAAAEIYGIDAASSFEVNNQLSLSGGVVWLPKRDFVEYQNDETGDTLSGNKLARVPAWTITAAAGYTQSLPGDGHLTTSIEYNYRSGFFYTKENLPVFSHEGFGLLNLFMRFEPGSEKWYLFVSGRNLTDEDYFTQVFIQSSPGYPATYEFGFGLRF
ncbi:MAG TPA: TonB-dependent receptor [Woeseiaceae bacterium]|nr:TonB-dependent receptor [Woeseiaceae bacterium]